MATGYTRLRVEDTPPAPIERRPVAPALDARLVEALRDAAFWKNEAKKAITEREEVKRSLEAQDGPAAHWRREAKAANQRATDALKRLDGARKREQEQRERALSIEEQLAGHEAKWQRLKRRLWDLWSDLADTAPLKQALWGIWSEM